MTSVDASNWQSLLLSEINISLWHCRSLAIQEKQTRKQVVKVVWQKDHVTTAHGRFNGICQVVPMCTPSNTCFLRPTQVHIQTVQLFLHSLWQSFPLLYNGRPLSPSNLYLRMKGDLDPHLTHDSLGPPESTTQTSSWLVQPFSAGLTIMNRPTDRPRYSICNNRPHLHSTVMWPLN